MKKITFILFALIAGTTFAQNTAEGKAEVQAFIVQPLTISMDGGVLGFGDINKTPDGGNVTVEPGASTRQIEKADMEISSLTDISSASFEISAAENFTYTITVPSITLSPVDAEATGATMKLRPIFQLDANDKVTALEDSNATQVVTGSGTTQKLGLGGILTVNGDQAEGAYEGTVTVTVTYQ